MRATRPPLSASSATPGPAPMRLSHRLQPWVLVSDLGRLQPRVLVSGPRLSPAAGSGLQSSAVCSRGFWSPVLGQLEPRVLVSGPCSSPCAPAAPCFLRSVQDKMDYDSLEQEKAKPALSLRPRPSDRASSLPRAPPAPTSTAPARSPPADPCCPLRSATACLGGGPPLAAGPASSVAPAQLGVPGSSRHPEAPDGAQPLLASGPCWLPSRCVASPRDPSAPPHLISHWEHPRHPTSPQHEGWLCICRLLKFPACLVSIVYLINLSESLAPAYC